MIEKAKSFQIRWNEPLGKPECPYMYRWVLIFFGYSIRVHHWVRSDDKRFFHDHPWNFITIVLKGQYTDYSPPDEKDVVFRKKLYGENSKYTYDPNQETLIAGDIRFRKAEHKHFVVVPNSCWTLLFTGRPNRKWGFWIKANQFFRPLRYFSKYGHPPCSEQ